ncbi:MAG: peptide-methionine (S)-S-oxide reductase MsrA [Betaproteobacteria bacterium]|nr:peptide-methionine (S)-S-oxide reductase MsrA [Betaproteobacteria bacterium]
MGETRQFELATELATLGGGCFWCLESVFLRLRGVSGAVSGYCGGHVSRPNYALVCTGETGHAEVVQVKFDPAVLTYQELLEVFFAIHDPTTLNRQGHDTGTQYRSVIFTHSAAQAAAARATISRLEASHAYPEPIVTEVLPLEVFYAAEDYHQDYFANNPMQPYCQAVVAPKVAKFLKLFGERSK